MGRKREVPLERDVRKAVLRTKPDFHSNETIKGTYRDEVGSTGYFPNITLESHWKNGRSLQEGYGI